VLVINFIFFFQNVANNIVFQVSKYGCVVLDKIHYTYVILRKCNIKLIAFIPSFETMFIFVLIYSFRSKTFLHHLKIAIYSILHTKRCKN
jgi:hypothetical protein